MLLASRYGVQPEYFRCPPDLTEMLLEADAGGAHRRPGAARPARGARRGLLVTDLGAGLARLDRPADGVRGLGGPARVRGGPPGRWSRRCTRRSCASRELCLAELDAVAEAAARWEPFAAATLADYFRALDFSLGERQVAGLREFAARAASAGAAPALPVDGPVFFPAG